MSTGFKQGTNHLGRKAAAVWGKEIRLSMDLERTGLKHVLENYTLTFCSEAGVGGR